MQKEFTIQIDWRGFELHPETPPGGRPIEDLVPAGRLSSLRNYLREFAASFGVTGMGFPSHLPNTRRALALAEYAREQGKLAVFCDAAMDAHWHEGKNLEDEDDLRSIASRVGLVPDAAIRAASDEDYLNRVEATRKEASERGVTGIPALFIGKECVVGCQPYEVLVKAVERAGAQRCG